MMWAPGLCAVQIQWYEEVALVRNGRVLHVLSAAGSRGVLPQLHSVSPLAFPSSAPATLKLLGSNLATPDNTVLAQSQGALKCSLSGHVGAICSLLNQQIV